MTDFVQFLYTQYIQSYIDAMPMDATGTSTITVWSKRMHAGSMDDIEAIRAFAAAHAFLLGLRTGAGAGRTLRADVTSLPYTHAATPPRDHSHPRRPHAGAGRAGTSPAPTPGPVRSSASVGAAPAAARPCSLCPLQGKQRVRRPACLQVSHTAMPPDGRQG